MRHLLRIEWMKVKNYRTFWILLAITIVSIPGFNYMFYDLFDNSFPKVRGKSILGSPFAFPDVWQSVSWTAGLIFIIPAILIITLNTNEFAFRTHRQNIIDGWSRGQYIGVKMTEIGLLSLLTTLTVILTSLAFGFWTNKVEAGTSIWQSTRFVAFYFVQMISYSMIALIISTLIKRAGLAIGLFFLYWLVENVLVGIVHNKYKLNWVNYLPQEVTDELIPQSYIKAIFTADKVAYWEQHIPIYLAVAAAYLLVYIALVSRYFLKSDL